MTEWRQVRIGDFLHRVKQPVKLEADKDYKLVTVRMHHNGVVQRELKKGKLIGSNMYRVNTGQFILSGIDARHGAFGIVPEKLDGAIVTNDFWYFEVDENVVSRDFFLWLTTTPLFLDACIKSSEGTTNRRRLQSDKFFNFSFHFPEIGEQKRLAKRFNSIDMTFATMKDEFEQQSEYLKQLRQAVLQEAVEGKLTAAWRKKHQVATGDPQYDAAALLAQIKADKERLVKEGKIRKEKPLPPITDDFKPFALPDGWGWCRLGDYGYTQTGTTPSTADKANFGGFIPFVKPADITTSEINYENEGLSEKGLIQGRLIDNSSVLMVCIGGSIGKSFFTDRDVSCNQQINTVTPLGRVEARFLQQFLQSTYFQTAVWDKAMKSSTPIINKGKWEEILLPLPPLAEQQAIVDRVNSLMAVVDELEMQVSERKDQAQLLMQTVLREAFDGDLEVMKG